MADFFHRIKYIRICLAILLILLMGRAIHLSLWQGYELAEQSVSAHILEVGLGWGRGDIYDRHGIRITNREASLYIAVFPVLVTEPKKVIEYVARSTGREYEEIEKRYQKGEPFCLPTEHMEEGEHIAGVVTFARKRRYVPQDTVVHAIGYTQEDMRCGIGGIEAMCDERLSSQAEDRLRVVTDGTGSMIEGLPHLVIDGQAHDVTTTLDWALQQNVERVFDRHGGQGAVIVMTVEGEILAMVSRPSFCLGEIGDCLQREDAPLVDRAVMPVAVGSVFKIVTALAGLESGMVQEDDIWEDRGRIEVAGITFHGWDDNKEYIPRQMTIAEAMAHSSNSVFIQLGMKIGADRIIEMAKRLGFGRNIIEEMAEEEAGELPSDENIYPAELANLSIGQGALLASPMQVTKMMAIVASGGYEVIPHLVIDGRRRTFDHRLVGERTIANVQKMLAMVTDEGTGRPAQTKCGQAAGKTGSAETGRMTADGKSVCHAWFSGYFPREEPRYICTVFVENGGSGGDVAAPIFREIMEIIR